MREGLALKTHAVLVGIAPQGGRLPEEWRAWLAEALDAGCDLWSGLHTFLGGRPGARGQGQGGGPKDIRPAAASGRSAGGLGRSQSG